VGVNSLCRAIELQGRALIASPPNPIVDPTLDQIRTGAMLSDTATGAAEPRRLAWA